MKKIIEKMDEPKTFSRSFKRKTISKEENAFFDSIEKLLDIFGILERLWLYGDKAQVAAAKTRALEISNEAKQKGDLHNDYFAQQVIKKIQELELT